MFLCNLVGLGATFQPGVKVDPVRARQAARGMKRAIRFGEGLIDAILDEDLEAASIFVTLPNRGVQGLPAPVEALDDDGRGVLYLATRQRSAKIVELLLGRGAKLVTDNPRRHTDHNTALHLAAQLGEEDILESLADYFGPEGGNLDIRNSDGKTALHLATESGNIEMVRQLIEKRASLEVADEDGYTALLLAAKGGHEDVVQLLIEKKPDLLDVRDANGSTALHVAAASGNRAIVELLIGRVIDLEARDNDGKTALDLANSEEIRGLIRQAVASRQEAVAGDAGAASAAAGVLAEGRAAGEARAAAAAVVREPPGAAIQAPSEAVMRDLAEAQPNTEGYARE